VVYADNASTVELRELLASHRADAVATLGLFRVPDPERRGVVEVDGAGTVVGFVEKPARPRSDLAWAGILVGTPALLDAIPVLDFDAAAADHAANAGRALRDSGTPLPMADLAIAGICLSLEVPILSRNVRHFERIEGLEIAATE